MTEAFDNHMKKLLSICEDIQKAKDGSLLKLSSIKKVNPIVKYFNNYSKVYKKTEANEHVLDVQALFKRHRNSILRGGADDDTWLREKSVTLFYTDGCEATKDVKIMLSTMYNTALQVKETTEKQLEGLGQEAYEDRAELMYADLLRFTLYQIFSEAVEDPKDKESLRAIVTEMEKELGLSSTTESTGVGLNLGSIITEATNFAKQQGIVNSDVNVPNQGDFGAMLGKLFNNPQLKETLGGLLTGLQDCKTPDQLFGKVGESLKKIAPNLQEITRGLAPSNGDGEGAGPAPAPPTEKPLIDM